ncbi:MAG: hypothetical protein PQJ49_12480 [Sphaerochaetaceae bacterium]|nr:hypothetical protein [Sphaerochaetaceae bacterium]
MKIQLDYDRKVISLQNNVNLKEFVEKIESIIPDWREWTLETTTIHQNWTNPIIIDTPVNPPIPWWQQPTVMYDTNQISVDENQITGTYCLEVKG